MKTQKITQIITTLMLLCFVYFNSIAQSGIEVEASTPEEGVLIKDGRLGFGKINTDLWYHYIQIKQHNHYVGDLQFWSKVGAWGDTTSQLNMTLTVGGNLGIGVETPRAKLHVAGAYDSYDQFFGDFRPAILARGGIGIGAAYNDNTGSFIASYNDANHDGIYTSIDSLEFKNSSTIAFYTGGIWGGSPGLPKMVINGATESGGIRYGYIGMGCTNPQQRLDVRGNLRLSNINDINDANYHAWDFKNGPDLKIQKNGADVLTFYSDPSGTDQKAVLDYKLGIGTDIIPAGFDLAVEGKSIMEELEIKLKADWPDYVFEPDYRLLSIEERTAFYKTHKRLPNFPSALEMDGRMNVGEVNIQQQEAIEENALYIGQLHEENQQLKEKNEALENRLLENEKETALLKQMVLDMQKSKQ